MSYTIKIDGFEVTAATPADAAALLRELRKTETQAPKAQEKPSLQAFHGNGLSASLAEFDPNAADTALKFLKAIRTGQTVGIHARVLMDALGVTVPKAIGSKSAAVNKTITRLGLKPKTVYSNPRTADGRVWKPGRKMGEAIQMLEERLAAH